MRILLIVLITIVMVGCTTYDIKRDSEGIIQVSVKSTRSFEQPNLHYDRNGTDVTFDFEAASVDNNTDAFMGAMTGVMGMMMQMMEGMMMKMSTMPDNSQ